MSNLHKQYTGFDRICQTITTAFICFAFSILLHVTFDKRNDGNEFIFDLNQNINTVKSKLKTYYKANVN